MKRMIMVVIEVEVIVGAMTMTNNTSEHHDGKMICVIPHLLAKFPQHVLHRQHFNVRGIEVRGERNLGCDV
jgi:hypothetical protein